MRKYKKLGFLMLFLSLFVILTSCVSNNNKTSSTKPAGSVPTGTTTGAPSYPVIDMNDVTKDTAGLTSITIDSSKAKTSYFVGEKIDTAGLIVTARFVDYVDGIRVTEDKDCSDKVSIDTSFVNMYAPGVYPVVVTYRKDTQSRSATYNIEIKSDILGVSGVRYIGGLDVTLKDKSGKEVETVDTQLQQNYYFNPTFTVKYYQSEKPYENGAHDFEIDQSMLKVEGLDKVNINKAGTYLVRFTYTGPQIEIDGVKYDNSVSTFVVFNVFDRVTKIELNMGETEFDASINPFTYSDWIFVVTREISGEKYVKYNPDTFTITGVNQYVAGFQTAVVTHNENGVSTEIEIKINPSSAVVVATDYTAALEQYEATKEAGVYQLDTKGIVSGKIDKIAAASSIINAEVSFSCKVTLKDSGYLDVNLEKPGSIIIYFTTTGADVRNLVYINEEGETLAYVESPGETNQVAALRISFDKAGTYRFTTESTGVYIYGVIVGYN